MNKPLVVAVALVLAGCGAPSGDDDSTTTSNQSPTDVQTTVPSETVTTREPPKAVDGEVGGLPDWFQDEDAAPTDLVEVIGDELDADYVGSMQVDWNNSGLGCTDGVTLTVITPGYLIFYEDVDGLIRVHAGENGRWIECDLTRPLEGIPVVTS